MTESTKLLHVISAGQQDVSSTSSADVFDRHNRPCTRRNIILSSLEKKYSNIISFTTPTTTKSSGDDDEEDSTTTASLLLTELYSIIHDTAMIQFLCTAYSKWKDMGPPWDKDNCHPSWDENSGTVPPLVPLHSAFRRNSNVDGSERPSTNVMGAIGYYATDMITPIVGGLMNELVEDAYVICTAVHSVFTTTPANTTANNTTGGVSYAVTTHPGHHASYDCFGGYCYLNNAALAARLLQRQIETGKSILNDDGVMDAANYWTDDDNGDDDDDGGDDHLSTKKSKLSTSSSLSQHNHHCPRVAILDVDYHCGNGTASIFYDCPDIFVCSIHCDPEIDYPWNSGFADQIGVGEGVGTTLHIPLPKGSSWHVDGDDRDSPSNSSSYKRALIQAMVAIIKFEPHALVVSLGLDTYKGDAVAVNRGGFLMSGDDYTLMGMYIGKCMMGKNIPCVFVQEGGYKMDVVGDAAADVVGGYAIAVSGGAIADDLVM